MPKARRIRLVVHIELPQWVDRADIDALERDLANAAAERLNVVQRSVQADIRTLEVL